MVPTQLTITHTPPRKTPRNPLLVVSDDSCSGHSIGYAAVLLDSCGILATASLASRASLVKDASSWAAEWLGRLLAIELVRDLPGDVCSVADNLAVSLGAGDVKSSGSDVVDRIAAHMASFHTGRRVLECYIPAEHDTGWTSNVALAQRQADHLAKDGIVTTPIASLPCLDIVAPHSLLLISGKICIRPSSTILQHYDMELSGLRGVGHQPLLGHAGANWCSIVCDNLVPVAALRSAMWLRSATRVKLIFPRMYCPYCALFLTDWPLHFAAQCPVLVSAVRRGSGLSCLSCDLWTGNPRCSLCGNLDAPMLMERHYTWSWEQTPTCVG